MLTALGTSRRVLATGAATILAALAVTAFAVADTINVEVTNHIASDTATVQLKPGGSGSATYWLVVDDNSTDLNGCNVGTGGQAPPGSMTFTNPDGKLDISSTGPLTFTDCDDLATATVREGAQTASFAVKSAAYACVDGNGDPTTATQYATLVPSVSGGKTGTDQQDQSASFSGGTVTVEIDCTPTTPPPAVCDSPAAPAILIDALRTQYGLKPSSTGVKNAAQWAASRTGQGKEFGNDPCATGYVQNVVATWNATGSSYQL